MWGGGVWFSNGVMTSSIFSSDSAVSARHLYKTFGAEDARVLALNDVSVDFERGRFTAIMGPSGSGKSTLLHVLSGLDVADPAPGSSLVISGFELMGAGDRELTAFRSEHVGFVFQSFNLVPTLTVLQNIEFPMGLTGRPVDEIWRDHLVQSLGLGDRLRHLPHQLSGGQQQRVAIARALLARPSVIFADEPTGNLDSVSTQEVLALMKASSLEHGQTIVMVTHDPLAAAFADRVVLLKDGAVSGFVEDPTAESVLVALAGLGG